MKSSEELYDTDLTVGEILRRTRVHYGQSLQDVERAIRVRVAQIDAIEKNETDKLPGRVYAIGFVRSYSEYLGLDGGKMVDLFKRQQGGKTRTPDLDFPVAASDSKVPSWAVVALSVFATVLVSLLIWKFAVSGNPDETEIPAVPESIKNESLSIDVYERAPDRQAPGNSSEIFINVTENSWVEIKDEQGGVLVSRVLEAGEQYYIPNRPDLSITMGNAGGVQFDAGDGNFISFGQAGESLSDIPLDLEYLKGYFAAGPEVPSDAVLPADAVPAAPPLTDNLPTE